MTIREAVLLSAGLGTRMRPVTLGLPKPVIPFLNRPLMYWSLDALHAAGVRRVFVNLHHLPDKVRETAAAYGRGMEFLFFHEPELLGTAGFLGPMGPHFEGESFYVVNGDILHETPWEALNRDLAGHNGALATLALRSGNPSYTGVSIDGTGVVRGFAGGPFMFTGAYAARRRLIERLERPGRKELVPDLLGPLLETGAVRGLAGKGLWEDLGSPSAFLDATVRGLARLSAGAPVPAGSRLAERNGVCVLVHESARVHPTAVFSGPAVVGENAAIGERARCGRCVLLPGSALEAGRTAERCILSPWGSLRTDGAPGSSNVAP